MTAVKVFTAGGWRELGFVAPSSVPIEAWHTVGAVGEPAFTNSWVNLGAPYGPAQFRKSPDGMVELRGIVQNGTAASAAFTLPVDYRPSQNQVYVVQTSTAAGVSRVDVTTAGAVSISGPGGAIWYSLYGIRFFTDQATFPTGPAAPEAFAPRVTSLPASPVDGQEIVYVADAANGVLWRLRYNAGAVSVYKWEFVGGSAVQNAIDTEGSLLNTTYVDLGAGPQVTLPLAGDYDITVSARVWNGTSLAGCYIGAKLGSAATVDADSVVGQPSAANSPYIQPFRTIRRTMTTAGVVKHQYKVTAGTGWFGLRTLAALPVRVG